MTSEWKLMDACFLFCLHKKVWEWFGERDASHGPEQQQEACSFNAATQLLETPQTVGEFWNFSIFTPRMRLPVCLVVATVAMRPPPVYRAGLL